MRLLQSSIIIASLTLLATCFAENEASIRGLKEPKSSKSKSVKSFKSSKNGKAAKRKKAKTKSLKSAKSTKRESCKLKKSSKDFNRVIEEYDTYNNMSLKKTGLPSFLNPVVDNLIEQEGDYDSICLEDAVVECSRRCAEEDGKCTTFEVAVMDVTDYPMYYCSMINNNMNEFNQKRIYQYNPTELSLVGRYVYNNKLAPPLKVDEMPEGIFPGNPASADFQNYAVPGVSCVGTQGGMFAECGACSLPLFRQYNSCFDFIAGICGGVTRLGDKINFFSDDTCGQACFSGKASNYACLSTLQTYVLAVQGQAFTNDPSLGAVFGCTTSNIFDPTTGEKFPDYTCPPNTNQPVPALETKYY